MSLRKFLDKIKPNFEEGGNFMVNLHTCFEPCNVPTRREWEYYPHARDSKERGYLISHSSALLMGCIMWVTAILA